MSHCTDEKKAIDCPRCRGRFEMFDKRLREAVGLFEQDLIRDGADPEWIAKAMHQARTETEQFIKRQWGEE